MFYTGASISAVDSCRAAPSTRSAIKRKVFDVVHDSHRLSLSIIFVEVDQVLYSSCKNDSGSFNETRYANNFALREIQCGGRTKCVDE